MTSPVDPGLQAVFDALKADGVALPDPAEVGIEAVRAARARYYAWLNQPDGALPVDAIRRSRAPTAPCGCGSIFRVRGGRFP